jgi:DNA invertase Pin-like site-specific DNA recombinase
VKGYIGYIRVSTVKQGMKGVSLIEQRDAILRFAERMGFAITTWLEEMETAAKQGRPIFNQALKLLRTGKAQGIILHKLDRGARNLRDWAAIGELSDQGVEVHFVNESIDLQSRGGRLSADIQAVVAADYIRNLREETRKGFYGRLKQGLYPLRAPIGYLDQGKGKAKTIDPIMGPLVRKVFEMYATGRYSLETLGEELHRFGLRNRNGGAVKRNGFSTLLNNSFYIGLIQIQKTGESFVGIHNPIIGKNLFDRVQAVLSGKKNAQTQRHAFQFRRMLACADCQYSLIGERQKGHVYYRCHSRRCAGTAIREEIATKQTSRFFEGVQCSEEEKAYFRPKVLKMRETQTGRLEEETKSQLLKLGQVKDRMNRLTDAYLDQSLDKAMFEERKKGLLLEQKATEECLTNLKRGGAQHFDRLERFLELAGNAWLSYQLAFPEEKREMLEMATSNRLVALKNVELEPSLAFQPLRNRFQNTGCDLQRDIPRTWDKILGSLAALNSKGLLPDLSAIPGFVRRADATDPVVDGQDDDIVMTE